MIITEYANQQKIALSKIFLATGIPLQNVQKA